MKLLSTERPMFGTRVMVRTTKGEEHIAALYASGQFFRDNFAVIETHEIVGWRPLTDEEANAEPIEKPTLTLPPEPAPVVTIPKRHYWQRAKRWMWNRWNNVICRAIEILERMQK
jgi:hypothetical protein